MNLRIGLLIGLLPASVAIAQGCVVEDNTNSTKKTTTTTTDTGSPGLPGSACNCDADCEGEGALCLLGMCAKRANGMCPVTGEETGCEPGFLCFNTDILLDSGVCFPLYDAASCDLVENRRGVCSPVRGVSCDAACGATCVPDVTFENTPGAACVADSQCTFHADGACYSDSGVGEPNGWVEGYCLAFGCKSDAECGGADKGCMPAASDGSGVCMNRCGMDLDCRAGYVCSTITDDNEMPVGNACFAGCDAAATCPAGFACMGKICVDEKRACGTMNLYGWCPEGSWCDEGVCNDQPFACDGTDDALEPNDSFDDAKEAPVGQTQGLRSCAGNEDWFKISVAAGKLVRVGINFMHAAGDLDLIAYDANNKILGSRYGKGYPYKDRDFETDTEYYGFYSQNGGTYYVRVVGYGPAAGAAAENGYTLNVDAFDYVDGESCTLAGFTFDECAGHGPNGSGLLPFPFPDPADSVVGELFMWDTVSNYRFARRELIMLVRHAITETAKAFPDTNPLGLIDTCQIDGITPGYDIGSPRHPETTHDQGGNMDLAYYQVGPNNSAKIVCGDGSKHADGFCSPAAVDKHTVDLERQAFFMAQMYKSSRVRVIGVDKILGPLIEDTATALSELPESDPKHISKALASTLKSKMAYGDGWPFHHHHIHLSLQWWTSGDYEGAANAADGANATSHSPFAPYAVEPSSAFSKLDMAWPPRR